ncbi:serine hydrolase domain-containing protein [Nocardiopsis ansamitocini]|uniref:Beta-lactamase-related domain-containing protein n=1 Tax=Nocardiopsis ansamitocini TaxID=1670832 RepID=A0A9W6PBC4_9ACTN|nr:serine hydrolase domain-containing protein [Nocardiopsis ansamitocini]GLU50391.1 hypothetical protein Nans01_47420 [Nocardiopsis ansamitocini]
METNRRIPVAGAALTAAVLLTLSQGCQLTDIGWAPVGRAAAAPLAPDPPQIPADERASLQERLDEVVTEGSSGVVAELVVTGPGGSDVWTGTSGTADRATGAPIDQGAHFRIASISKPFLATVLLELVGEGRVELDGTVEEYLPGLLNRGDEVTLRMLLSHTSGIYSFSRSMPPVLGTPDRQWRPEELVAIANEHEFVFEPGQGGGYSNTNYVLVAMVIEKVTGVPYDQEVSRRLLEPLGLDQTFIPSTVDMPAPVLHAYLPVRAFPGAEPEPAEITEFNPTRWYGTAQIVSTVADVNHFYTELLGGKVLDPPELAQMLTVQGLSPQQGYGYGLGPHQRRLSCGVQVWMHSGHIPGYRTWTVHSEDRHFTMFQARFDADPDAPAWSVIETALCPPETGGPRPEVPSAPPSEAPSAPPGEAGRGSSAG